MGVRIILWQRIARWPRIKARGCRPRHGGESPSRASMSIRCDGTGILPRAAPRGTGDPAASRRGKSRHSFLVPLGSRIAVQVVVVQRRGCEHATFAMRVRLPPATRSARFMTGWRATPTRGCRRTGRQPGSWPTGPPRCSSSSARSAPGTTSSSRASTSAPWCGRCCTRSGIGNLLARAHIAKRHLAKDLERRPVGLDLAYFVEGTPEFAAYIGDMLVPTAIR